MPENDHHPLPPGFARRTVDIFGQAGEVWLTKLPAILAACAAQWSLTHISPLPAIAINYVATALRADGTSVILKAGVPNSELTTEIAALSLYNGRGAVRLLAVDEGQGAFLLEHLRPGTPLANLTDDQQATHLAAKVMRGLWQSAPPQHPFPTVEKWAAGLANIEDYFQGSSGPLPQPVVSQAKSLFANLCPSQSDKVILHGDLHHFNILQANGSRWLAIDPKGIIGEPAYEPGAWLRNVSPNALKTATLPQILARRLAIFAEVLTLDPQRIRAWAIAQAVLAAWWSVEMNSDTWRDFINIAEALNVAR